MSALALPPATTSPATPPTPARTILTSPPFSPPPHLTGSISNNCPLSVTNPFGARCTRRWTSRYRSTRSSSPGSSFPGSHLAPNFDSFLGKPVCILTECCSKKYYYLICLASLDHRRHLPDGLWPAVCICLAPAAESVQYPLHSTPIHA
ncbi:hypothetical protein PVAP13_5KG248807 [Panicum virgatum]|uniref:Uncharacterized protein n=1 Tax=Panicum virgatum TaxID=38727 RepID=A0A8T0SL78_PANVG|nr:hypothetical protein PVAP13_5KG248807 [Panicum virgatum]